MENVEKQKQCNSTLEMKCNHVMEELDSFMM